MEKRTYSAPLTQEVRMAMESLIAVSLVVDPDKSGNEQLAPEQGGWDSSNWSVEDEE